MTRKLEEEFNLPPLEEVMPVEKTVEKKEITEVEVKEALTNAEKIDSALPKVKDLTAHDNEMEDIASKALDSYDELMNLGMNVQDAHAGRVFETASKMLQIAMDSKNAKVDKKLKMIDLQIRKMRLDQNEGVEQSNEGSVMDRNHILQI